MTNTIDTRFANALFTQATRNSKQEKAQPLPQARDVQQIPSPSMQAGQIVSRVNRSSSLSHTFKREAIMLTAMVDGIAPAGRQQAMLRSLSSQIARQEQVSIQQGVQNQPELKDAQALFNQTREAVLLPMPGARGQGQDNVQLSPQARGRVLAEGFENPQVKETLANLGSEAVAEIFGEPPGVRSPENGRLPAEARMASPQEIRDERVALRESILRRITAGKFPE